MRVGKSKTDVSYEVKKGGANGSTLFCAGIYLLWAGLTVPIGNDKRIECSNSLCGANDICPAKGDGMALKALVALVVMASMAHAAAEHPVFPVDRDFYPYYPSLMRWEKTAAPFTPPEVCGGCHQTQHREWNGSVHQLAFQDPVYQGELNKAVKAVGHEVSRQCEGCHSPIGVLTGEVKQPGLAGLSSLGMNGVSCDICHSISSVTHTRTPAGVPENGSFVLRPGEDGKDGPVLVKRGPNKPSEGCGGGFHSCEQSPLITKADLCASCHQVYHYEAHFPLEATYNEWKQGPYAQKNIHCQDCHMVATATFKRSADEFKKPAKGEYRHYFNGANYLLYYLASAAAKKAGDEALAANLAEKYLMAIDRLKAAAGMEIMPVYRDGTLAEIKIRVKNIRAGHNLPTSLTNVRQMWLEVTARDEGARYSSPADQSNRTARCPTTCVYSTRRAWATTFTSPSTRGSSLPFPAMKPSLPGATRMFTTASHPAGSRARSA